MASKDELQNILKEKYGINKNISQLLDKAACERLIFILASEPSAVKLVESFAQKNSNLGHNNAYYSRMRNQADKRYVSLQSEYRELEIAIQALESSKITLEDRKKQLQQESDRLNSEVQNLSSENIALASKVGTLTSKNDELIGANEQLKKDNKDLKNVVDAIRLRLARDTKILLQYEDSEIRKAVIRLFRWTLG
ncbi:MAG: hypothetical protein HC780_00740 [Leptolyngbyaceae cyanobacterium CSU_1_3]|nr:hypothetical protein [Leptolyngbyaceae cyanobacterium CSU_1_3]